MKILSLIFYIICDLIGLYFIVYLNYQCLIDKSIDYIAKAAAIIAMLIIGLVFFTPHISKIFKKGCLYSMLAIFDLIGIFFITFIKALESNTPEDIQTDNGIYFCTLFIAFIFFLPNIYYIIHYLIKKNKNRNSLSINKTNIEIENQDNKAIVNNNKDIIELYPEVQVAPTINYTNDLSVNDSNAIYINKSIKIFVEKKQEKNITLTITNSSINKTYTIYIDNSINDINYYKYNEYHKSIISKYCKKLSLLPKQSSKIEFILSYFPVYGLIIKIILSTYNNYDPTSNLFKTLFIFQIKENILYYRNIKNPIIDDSYVYNDTYKFIRNKEFISDEDKSLLLRLKPLEYKIEDIHNNSEIIWLHNSNSIFEYKDISAYKKIEDYYNSLLINKKALIPMYKTDGNKALFIYYNKEDDLHNYTKGDKWIFQFESEDSIELETISSPRKIASYHHNRLIILSLTESHICKLSSERLINIYTKHIDAYDQNIKLNINPNAWNSFYFMKLFEAYKNALFDCGYKWGEEEEKEINTPLLSETECYVYIMHDEVNNFYKIGISNKPKYRERTLQSEKPSITLIKAKKFPTRAIAKAFESALHTTYSNKHKRGEWFELDEQDVNQIKESLS